MHMLESRQAERVRTFLRARIVFNNNNSTIDCTVKNISASGAKIDVSDAVAVPEFFDLIIPQKGQTYRARIAWRDEQAIGVNFVTADQASPNRATLDRRTEQLERENRRLRAEVVALTKRLEDLGQAVDHSF